MRRRLVLGIDGGGTTTRALLATPAGQVVAEGEGGPANFQAVGHDAALSAISTAIDTALAALPDGPATRDEVDSLVAGLAGIHVQDDVRRYTALLSQMVPQARVRLVNDVEVALAGATAGQPGIVVVAGTGSIAMGVNAEGIHLRCGGWGYIIGDEGSAYAIVLRALRAASSAADLRTSPTILNPALCTALGVPSLDESMPTIYGPPAMSRHHLAALAPVVARCAADGDAAALTVLAEAGEDLATMPISLAQRLSLGEEGFPVAYSGSVWKAGEPVLGPFRRRVQSVYPHARIVAPLLTPGAGAVLLALALLPDISLGEAQHVAALHQTHALQPE